MGRLAKKLKRRLYRLFTPGMWKVGLWSLWTTMKLMKLHAETRLDEVASPWEKEKGRLQGTRELTEGDISVPRWVAGLPAFFYPLYPKKCLRQALVLYKHLLRFGYTPEIWVGIRKQGNDLAGHAWVVLDGKVLGEKVDPKDDYTPIMVLKRGKTGSPPSYSKVPT